GLALDHVDAVEPLARLVAVHRRHVDPHRSTVLARDRLAVHRVRHNHVRAQGLIHRQALGVLAVEGMELDAARTWFDAGPRQQVTETYADPLHVVHAPAGDALEVLVEVGGRHRLQVGEGEIERLVDVAPDLQPVLGLALVRQFAGDRVDPKAPDRQEARQPRAVAGRDRRQRVLQPVLRLGPEDHARGRQADHAEEDAAPDGGALGDRGCLGGARHTQNLRRWGANGWSAPGDRSFWAPDR